MFTLFHLCTFVGRTRVACELSSCLMNHGRSSGYTGGEFENKTPLVTCYALVTTQPPVKKSSISSTDLRAGALTGRTTQTVTHRRSAITPTKCRRLSDIHNIDFFWCIFYKLIRFGKLNNFLVRQRSSRDACSLAKCFCGFVLVCFSD